MAARSFPVGASSDRAAGETWSAMAKDDSTSAPKDARAGETSLNSRESHWLGGLARKALSRVSNQPGQYYRQQLLPPGRILGNRRERRGILNGRYDVPDYRCALRR